MASNRMVIMTDEPRATTWLLSRLSAIVHRSHKKGVVYFFSGDFEILTQLGYIRQNSAICTVAVLPNTDQMLEMMEAVERAGSVLPDQVFILNQDATPDVPETVQKLNCWQFRNADYLVYIGSLVSDEMKALGFPIVHINPEIEEVNWIINGRTVPFN